MEQLNSLKKIYVEMLKSLEDSEKICVISLVLLKKKSKLINKKIKKPSL